MFGFWKNIFAKDANSRLFGDVVDDTTTRVMKRLAGADNARQRKLPDNVIAFIGAAGGVGTSTILNNTAYALARNNLSVLICDLNTLYPSVQNFYRPQTPLPDLVDFLVGKVAAGGAIKHITSELSVLCAHNRTLFDLLFADTEKTAEHWGATLEKLSELYDIVMIDLPNHLELELVGETIHRCDRLYIVWNEDVKCPAQTERLRYCAEDGVGAYINAKSRIIINKRTGIYYTNEPIEKLGIRMCTEAFPYDAKVLESGLFSEIFIEKGSGTSYTAKMFEKRVYELAQALLDDASGVRGMVGVNQEKVIE
ncbi:hypothetical protein AGMMS49975_28510 [Clostridia bacterium]|nr:hypothetical protein AGMMS49975_28510 [Clostridia bacterium]